MSPQPTCIGSEFRPLGQKKRDAPWRPLLRWIHQFARALAPLKPKRHLVGHRESTTITATANANLAHCPELTEEESHV